MVRSLVLVAVAVVLPGCVESSLASSRIAPKVTVPAPEPAKPAPSTPEVKPIPVFVPVFVPVPVPVPLPLPLPTVDGVIQDCDLAAGYEVNTFETPAVVGNPTLWLTTVYETHSEHGGGRHPMGQAKVRVDAPGEHIVALASYEPVTWNVEVGPNSSVREILVWGYHQQLVAGAGDIPVRQVPGPSCGYSWPYNEGGCDTVELVASVEAAAGQRVQHFEGCYRANNFVIQ